MESLQETQDSIVSISQWVLFHHRHSRDILEGWGSYILKNTGDSSKKKLSLLYLCNDVVQQARHKRKPEFIKGFAMVLPSVLGQIYHTLDAPIKPKVDRLVKVWSERLVFAKEDLDKMVEAIKNSGKKTASAVTSEQIDPIESSNDSSSGSSQIVPELRLLNDLFANMNQLIDISQNNLNQVGIQSKNYLPNDPSVSDNLPSPKIYINKLNTLEKLCQISNKNIDGIKENRLDILKNLNNLKTIVEEGLKTDDSKKSIINLKLSTLHNTRNELIEMVNDEEQVQGLESEPEAKPEEPLRLNTNSSDGSERSGSKLRVHYEDEDDQPNNEADADADSDDDDDLLPTYDNDDSEEENGSNQIQLPPAKKFKKSPSSSGNSTPAHKKSVAFSENIEIKEYDRENRTEIIKIIKSDDDQTEVDEDEDEDGLSDDFSAHPKDDLEMKTTEANEESDDGYDPSGDGYSPGGDNQESSNGNSSVLDLLSKLQ